MNDWESRIQYIGFEPSEKVKRYTQELADRLLWQSPSDSSLKIEFVKTKGLFKVHCRVSSSVGLFIADGTSEFSLSALKLLERSMYRQLSHWKVKRNFYKPSSPDEQRVS